MPVEDVRAYLSGSPGWIREYDDEQPPIHAVNDFVALLNNSPFIDGFAPSLPAHLERFPLAPLLGAEDFL